MGVRMRKKGIRTLEKRARPAKLLGMLVRLLNSYPILESILSTSSPAIFAKHANPFARRLPSISAGIEAIKGRNQFEVGSDNSHWQQHG